MAFEVAQQLGHAFPIAQGGIFAACQAGREIGVQRDGTLLVNQPQTSNIGRSYKNTALFTRRIAAATSEVYRVNSTTDGNDAISSMVGFTTARTR